MAGKLLRSFKPLGFCALVGLGVFGASAPSQAVEFTAGGFGRDPSAFFSRPSAGLQSSLILGSMRAGSIAPSEFTPRFGAPLLRRNEVRAEEPRLFFGIERGWADRLLRPLTSGLGSGLRDTSSLMVGGALKVADLGVLGGLGRARLFGATTDIVSAGLSYGPLRARFAFGQSNDGSGTSSVRDVMMFSTDLAAWSWLTLEGDVAFGETAEDGDSAVGRLGIKLHF